MKDNTYVIPSIDFYIVREPEGYKGENLSTADARSGFNRLLTEEKKLDMVPFSSVDGLTVSEMATALNIEKYFLIVAASNMDSEIKEEPNKTGIVHYTTIFNDVMITVDEETANIEIDKVYEKYIKDVYFCSTDYEKRYYRSFLEKYRYQDYEKTKQKVKEFSMFNKKR